MIDRNLVIVLISYEHALVFRLFDFVNDCWADYCLFGITKRSLQTNCYIILCVALFFHGRLSDGGCRGQILSWFGLNQEPTGNLLGPIRRPP